MGILQTLGFASSKDVADPPGESSSSGAITLDSLSDDQIKRFLDSRFTEAGDLFDSIGQRYEANKAVWQGNPDWVKKRTGKESNVRTGRTFMDLEHVNAFLLARPATPHCVAGTDDEETRAVAQDVQDYLIDFHNQTRMREKVKRAFRRCQMSRLFSLKVVWNHQRNDFDLKDVHPSCIRFRTTASREIDTDWMTETVEEPLYNFCMRFDEATRTKIYGALGKTQEQAMEAMITDEKVKYKESWISFGDEHKLIHEVNNTIVRRVDNPYWDWNKLMMTDSEASQLSTVRDPRERLKAIDSIRSRQGEDADRRVSELDFNLFMHPRKPYIIATMFDIEEEAVGATDLFDQSKPLQENADRRAKQIDENAQMVNGIWLVDKDKTKLTKAEAAQLKPHTEGYIWCSAAQAGISRETGQPLPAFVLQDLQTTHELIDEVIGASATFRGAREGQETAEGRAILREQSQGRMNEAIQLIDYVYGEIYRWHLHFIRTRYTEAHFRQFTDERGNTRKIEMRAEFIPADMKLEVIPGQTLPQDRVYRSLRASKAFEQGLITPMRYLEETGWDSPEKLVKESLMFRISPLSMLEFTDEEKQRVAQAVQQQQAGQQDEMQGQRVKQVQQAKEMLQSPEFQEKTDVEKARIIDQLEASMPELKR